MRILMTLVSMLTTLGGCEPSPGSTTFTVSSLDGVAFNASRASVSAGSTRFECLYSASGRCHYLVYEPGCRAATEATLAVSCAPRPLHRFELASGQASEIQGLSEATEWCMDPAAAPQFPGCRKA